MKVDYLQADLDDLENGMPVIRDIPWYEKALNGVGGTVVSLARDNTEGIAFIPYGIVDSIFGSNLNYNLSQKLDNAEEYLINNVVTDKQSYYYGKAVGNAICVAEGMIFIGAGLKIISGGITLAAGGILLSATGVGAALGGAAIAISGSAVAVGTAITAVGGRMIYSSADNFKENISKAEKAKVEVDDLKQKEDIKKLDDRIKQAKKDISKIDEGVSNPRNISGVAIGGENLSNPVKSMRGSNGNIGVVPKEVADKLRGREFNSFDDFRNAFWKEYSTSSYASEFSKANIKRMSQGLAPKAPASQQYKSISSYVLHHKNPIYNGGGVYDLDNLIISSPRMHQEILDKGFHFNK